jgi:hypothetical protein
MTRCSAGPPTEPAEAWHKQVPRAAWVLRCWLRQIRDRPSHLLDLESLDRLMIDGLKELRSLRNSGYCGAAPGSGSEAGPRGD